MDSKIEIAGVGEKMQYCVHELNDNTVRFAIKYHGLISDEIMGQAMLMVVKSVDILHASFVVEERSVYWLINEEVTLSDCFLYLKEENNPNQVMKQALTKSVKADDTVQMFCTLIHSKEESILVLTISHLCVDGSDGKYLLLKLLQAYRLLAEKGDTKEFHIKNGSRSVFQVYAKCSRKEYLAAMLPKMSKIKSEFPFEEEPGYAQIVMKTISAGVMETARNKGRALQATVNDLLITACYKAYAELEQVNADEAMSILAMMDLRCHCIEEKSPGLCNLSGPMSTELKQGAGRGFEEILVKIVKQTQQEKNNPIAGLHGMSLLHTFTKKLPFPLLLKAAKKVYGNFSIGMTNLGNLEAKELMLPGSAAKGCIFAGPLKKKPGMQIAAVGMDGEVTLCCIGEFGNKDAEKINRMLNAMERILQEFGADNS